MEAGQFDNTARKVYRMCAQEFIGVAQNHCVVFGPDASKSRSVSKSYHSIVVRCSSTLPVSFQVVTEYSSFPLEHKLDVAYH